MSFNKYDVIMKVLEIVEQDNAIPDGSLSAESTTQIMNFFNEVTVEGDKFENIKQSVIATRGSIAQGVIGIRDQGGNEVAAAIETLEAALTGDSAKELKEEGRSAALELLSRISEEGARENPSQPVLKSIGDTLWTMISKVETLSKASLAAWKVLEKLWS